jgi:UDP:flavonoid glycosyltransferase YjiC (YdhE family)
MFLWCFQISIPFGGDQFANANECVRLGNGKALQFYGLTEEKFKDAIAEVLNDPSYSNM